MALMFDYPDLDIRVEVKEESAPAGDRLVRFSGYDTRAGAAPAPLYELWMTRSTYIALDADVLMQYHNQVVQSTLSARERQEAEGRGA